MKLAISITFEKNDLKVLNMIKEQRTRSCITLNDLQIAIRFDAQKNDSYPKLIHHVLCQNLQHINHLKNKQHEASFHN